MIKRIIYFFLFFFIHHLVSSQSVNIKDVTGDENILYSQTKQVNQFFRRFNHEEDRFGNKLYKKDSTYRKNDELRNVYLNILFDNETKMIDPDLKQEFITRVSDETPEYLDFHGDNWYAEVSATFTYNKTKSNLLLFLKLEQERLGYKWVLTNVYFDKFLKLFFKGDEAVVATSFLHPMSHELDFMNLYKAFQDKNYVEYYVRKMYQPDYLTLLLYELKNGNMKFEGVNNLKFHFFQVDNWYFEVAFFNRSGLNTGWLISKLAKLTPEEKQNLLKFYQP